MKIYIATPVNGRKEKTLAQKRAAALYRVCEIIDILRKKYPDAEFHSSFDKDIRYIVGEAKIMGCCVQKVLECDAICLDRGWSVSNGCRVEMTTAYYYGKERIYIDDEDGTAFSLHCFVCKHCLPPSERENGKMCKLEECKFEEV